MGLGIVIYAHMCGIIGYIGKKQAADVIVEGLKTLEYRGYDSAGIAIVSSAREKGPVKVVKAIGKVADLEKKIEKSTLPVSNFGIGHTRWATHGGVTEENAHPHWGISTRITLIHNGIIENYTQIKEFLKKKGHTFRSETDTEALAHLIDYFYKGNLEKAVAKALKKARGAYAVVVISEEEPGKIVLARLSSPLLIGIGDDETIVASDATALVKHTKNIVYLDDGEMAIVHADSYKVFNIDAFGNGETQSVEKEVHEIDWDIEEAKKDGYDHFMLKEIMEEGNAVADTLRGRIDMKKSMVHLGGLKDVEEKLKSVKRLIITACGTASYAGMYGSYLIEDIAQLPVEVHIASELRTRDFVFEPDTAVLAISQSGETIDTLEALRKAKKAGVLTLGIVNVVGSTIARETDAGVYNHAGPEIAVASTKAYLSQITVLAMMAAYLAKIRGKKTDHKLLVEHLEKLPRQIDGILKRHDEIKALAGTYAKYDNLFFVGRKYNVATAYEGSIKLKEISYQHSEAYPAGEMKHGPIALLDENFPTIAIAPSDSVYEKVVSSIQEAKARGSRILAVGTKGNKELEEMVDDFIAIPKTIEMLNPVLAIVPLHLFAYYVAVALGRDVDKPRNLAKSVTVE